ncbi:uncharacterized protein LOC131255430 isoform X2 [Magnolia sinica]|uniref:uncharacterized protein LOC131255430 isoform X2 n=1 Tax=Magnolia sinica TaxID=86752 RepID=UPI002659193E|nr:uncharacterized protein LOC131255430 isoform X2 [Magnolia sinica]
MSRPQVTITLGRSGQVVKRADTISDGSHSDYVPSGSKRPVRERLGGSNVDTRHLYGGRSKRKRQRKDVVNDGNQYFSNARVGQDDLRHKLMRKNLSRRTRSDGEQHDGVDLREKLSRTVHAPSRIDARQRMPEPKATSLLSRIPPTRSADDLLQVDSLRKSYSAWTLDGLRHRSPDRLLGSSRGISSTRNVDGLRQVSSIRPLDAPRSNSFLTKGAIDASRPTTFMAKAPATLEAAKPVVRLPPPGMAEEPLSVAGLLHSLGLGKYSILFQAEEVDMTALKQMGDNDLKELGIPMGPRKKILLALLPRSKHRQSREV